MRAGRWHAFCLFELSIEQAMHVTTVRLAPGLRLEKTRETEAMPMLVRPEGKIQLNRTAAAILQLCDGSRDREKIVAEVMRGPYPQTRATEIVEFLDAARARGWISEE